MDRTNPADLSASLAQWRRRETYRRAQWRKAKRGTPARAKWFALLKQAKTMVARREKQLRDSTPLRLRALAEARKDIGIVEKGGNNRGPEVEAIIRENGGAAGEPWCGDAVAHWYRHAGSKAVNRSWASVYFLGRVAGVEKVSDPLPGDIVRYSFSHTGLFEEWVDRKAGTFRAVEGNTGASGAVSDSSSGGDGVKRKNRSTSQVTDFRRVTR